MCTFKDLKKQIVKGMEPSNLIHYGYRRINHVKPLMWAKVLEHHPNLSNFTFVWLLNFSLQKLACTSQNHTHLYVLATSWLRKSI